MYKHILLTATLTTLLLTGCTPYRPERLQGNENLTATTKAIKIGMTKEQVAATAGASVAIDPFNDDHWSYWQTTSQYGQLKCAQGRSLKFHNNRLRNITKLGSRHQCPAINNK